MYAPFMYRTIDNEFTHQLIKHVERQESSVLLGARYSGCHDVIDEVAESLCRNGYKPIVLDFSPRHRVQNIKKFSDNLLESIATNFPAHKAATTVLDDLLQPVDELATEMNQHVVLLASYVDSMAHHLARPFLRSVRALVNDGKLTVVLSGESNLHSLVYGPTSEFNCANQYVVQGFGQERILNFTQRSQKILGTEWSDLQEMARKLGRITGGNSELFTLLIRHIIASTETKCAGVAEPDVPNRLESINYQICHGADVFRRASTIVDHAPESWDELRLLIENGTLTLPITAGTAPTLLELSGVAHRERNRLAFSSPLMAEYIRDYYDTRRFGDLFAMRGRWDDAFRQYQEIDLEERIRPIDVDDRIYVQQIVDSLGMSLDSVATDGLPEVRELFAMGCKYILGFPTVVFCIDKNGWCIDPEYERCRDIDSNFLDAIMSSIPTDITPHSLEYLQADWDLYASVFLLPSLREERSAELVIIGDFDRRMTISNERREMTDKAVTHLKRAYGRAVEVRRNEVRSRHREQFGEIISQIFDALSKEALDVRSVLELAGRGLRKMRYKRALFCLVDPERTCIKGELDDSEIPSINSKSMREGWPLSEPTADLQPYVVHTRIHRIVPDASKEPLTDKSVVESTGMQGLAVVPMLNRANDVIGTIHVEREDGQAPAEKAVQDLLDFARQLAIAIEQSLRINALQSTLDTIPEPVAITDIDQRVIYANRPAAKLVDIASGWLENSSIDLKLNRRSRKVADQLSRSVEEERRILKSVEGISNRSEWRGYVLTDVIRDWRGAVVGSFMHIQNLDYIYRTFEALQMVASADSVASAQKAMLRATAHLGHKWQRLYLIDKDEPTIMQSALGLGFTDLSTALSFRRGQVRLSPSCDDKTDSWLCIENKKMVVCHYGPNMPLGHKIATDFGLEVVNVTSIIKNRVIAKKPGDFWIDIPLFIDSTPWGKLSLQCDISLKPEECAFLSVLAGAFSELLEAMQRNDENAERRKRWVHDAAETAMSSTAHSISTRLAALPALLTNYQMLADESLEIQELNDDFLMIWNDTANIIKRTRERLTNVVPKLGELDLVETLRTGLRSTALDVKHWSIQSDSCPVSMLADDHLLRSALLELVQNSIDAIEDRDSLRIVIRIHSKINNRVIIDYRDNGPGVPREHKDLIFNNFFTHRPGQKPGIGLGLAFVKRVVDAHHGTIRERGHQGSGAYFVITLPCGNISREQI